MSPHDERPNDDRFEALLAAASRDAPAPDADFLARLRERSAEAFVAATSAQPLPLSRRRRMIPFLSRALAAAAAVFVIVAGFLYWRALAGPPTFGQVLANLNDAQSLHLRVERGDETSEVWVSQPHRWRWEESAERYRIGDHARSWVVDEPANKAAPEASPYFDQGRSRLNVWAMLGLPAVDEQLSQRPIERVQRDGRDYYVYRLHDGAWGKTTIEAFVDADSGFLHRLEARDGPGPLAAPLTALAVLAFNEQVPEDKLLVKDTLSEDGRVGKVTDAQGLAALRPMAQERWTPVTAGLLLRPGDWLRTDPRGANAVACRLLKQTGVIVGPGSVVEIVSPTQLRLNAGELELNVPEGTVELLGPDGQKLTIKGRAYYQLAKEKLIAVAQEPLWLNGFKGTTANESIGALIANVDGRNEPLTVGYHKVTVDIRDQIARTTVEESFVNNTDGTLEGVFHFPLPQDASISGFGMWIGNELVMADVVEKQRAREIYEEILRERRDPGLLEWAGGNIFKARVFPIFAHSEKRIKIVYTQVLPLRGTRYRYSYALQSELLKLHPLRELNLEVRLNSAMPLKSVTCPTHPVRSDATANSARVEFTAKEYTPTRDFEVVVEVDNRQSDVTMIPHRRGADGYFMLQLTPPAPAGDWDRPVLTSSQPLNLLLVADTSASMDAGQRAQQAELVAAVLGSLTPRDTVNLACCDVECDWVFEKPVPADARNITAIRQFLAQRTSLGWTDLDKAFTSSLTQAGPQAHVVYIGDGTVTTGDADPAAFARRLQRLFTNPMRERGPTFHAIAVGSTYEPAAMKAIAAQGGGSFRRVTTERGPQANALELLYEITQPVLRDLKVEFHGLRAARVYPEELPNLPPGTQQIVLGRYLPEGQDQQGEVVVSGTLNDKQITYRRPISLRDAESGNSFIPRLWARQHLDHLLAQGASQTIRDEIIALSEDYQIITPYTSFLVLETDADRARFAVKRTFRMRDGEKFFQQGIDTARFELAQKQMKRAGTWRLGLRRTVLQQFATLGRDTRWFQPPQRFGRGEWGYDRLRRLGEWYSTPSSGPRFSGSGEELYFGMAPVGGGEMVVKGLAEVDEPISEALGLDPLSDLQKARWDGEAMDGKPDRAEAGRLAVDLPAGTPPPGEELARFDENGARDLRMLRVTPEQEVAFAPMFAASESALALGDYESAEIYGRPTRGRYYPNHAASIMNNFPQLPAPVKKAARPPAPTWPEDARALALSLLRTETLAKLAGGIEVVQQYEYFDTRWGDLSSRARNLALYAPTGWVTRSEGDNAQTLLNWCDKAERGVYSRLFQLGRVRAAVPLDLSTPPFSLNDHSLSSLEEGYRGYTATVEALAKDRALLVLKPKPDARTEYRVLIDTGRHVILSIEYRHEGKVHSTTKFDDFAEVAGSWWARKVETTDVENRLTSRSTLTVRALAADAFAQRVQDELAGREGVLLVRQPLPKVADAKKAITAGKATFEDHLTLLLHFAQIQQWTRVREQLDQCEKLAAGKPGLRWLQDNVLYVSRRHEELRKRVLEEAGRLAKAPGADATGLAGSMGDDHFLAQHLVNQAGNVLEVNERLAVLESLRPVYERQPKHTQAMKNWRQQHVNALLHAGRADESRKEYRRLATDYPRDHSVQQGYAQTFFQAGEYDAAYAWLKKVTVKEARWHTHERESLRNTYANFLQQQGRFADLVEYLAGWLKEEPESTSPYQEYLSALVRADQMEKATALAAQWLKEGLAGDLKPPATARLSAAVSFALGSVHNLYTDRPDERWHKPLAEVVRRHARHKTLGATADTIMQNGHFQQTDACRALRREFSSVLLAEIDKLTPEQVQRFVNWVWPNDPVIEMDAWRKVAAGLRKRWQAEKDADTRHALGRPLAQIYSGRLTPAELIAFLRQQHKDGPEQYRTQYANHLFNTLLEQPWTAEYENEAFTLLHRLSDAEDEGQRLVAAVAALHRLTDRMVQARHDALMKKVEHPEKLTRTELRAKQDENRKKARAEFADRLAQEHAKPAIDTKQWAAWLTVERMYLDILLERKLAESPAECWRILGDTPKTVKADDEPGVADRLDDLLRSRCLLTLGRLATRRDAKPEQSDRLFAFFDKGIAAGDEDGRYARHKYQLLVALDRPKDLEKALQEWVRANDPDNRWRLSLGYVLAEQGRIQEAIRLFEGVEFGDELGATAYRALADWYMVANRRDDHDRALVRAYLTTDENYLSRRLRIMLSPWQRGDGHLPSELDRDVLLLFAALFEKSTHPANYIYQIQQFYEASRDFRLLAVLADGVVGHTAAKVYPFLQGMQGVLGNIHEEATADSLFEHLGKLRKRAQTDIDHRALDLLEVLVRRRAAEIRNQPGPHVEGALAALQRAFKRSWSAGEPRLMADFLAGLGAISREPLAQEQLRQLEALHAMPARGSFDRLHIAQRYAATLWSYQRREPAADLLEAALKEFQDAHDGVLPVSAHDALSTFVSYLEALGRYARGEKVLLAHLKRPLHQQQTHWLTIRLYQLYTNCVSAGGEVSLGSGQALYSTLNKRIQDELGTPDQNHRFALVQQLCTLYRTAHDRKLADVADDLRAFAFKRVPHVLEGQTNMYTNIVSTVAQTLHDVAGPRDGLAFLIERIESEPAWFRIANQDGWNQHGGSLAYWRTQVKELGELEPRLLKIVTTELRHDLESRRGRNRNMYYRHNSYFWVEKADDFARVADEVFARRGESNASVQYIADYVYHGLGRFSRAIEMLAAAHKRGILDENGQAKLVTFLHEQKRYEESIALLRPLLKLRPDNLNYRVWLMHAYYQTKRQGELLALLRETEARFRTPARWAEHVIATLAKSCLDNQLYEQSVGFYGEVIPLHQRTHANRGIGNGTLSSYYENLARAYAGLRRTPEAVDAASGAIVSWGPTHRRRAEALRSLLDVLRASPDLDGYVVHLDAETAKSGKDSPIVRKALGQVYLEKSAYSKAIAQLRLAVELQPNDRETHESLLACFDRQGDKEGAVRQLLHAVQLSRRDINLYRDLGRRLAELKQPKEAERANTSIVEMQPQESESHTLLAEVRQQQDRWSDAIAHWQRVADIRALEPTGLLKLAAAQVHEKQWEKAAETLKKLRAKAWPRRFDEEMKRVRELQRQVEAGSKK